MFYDTHAHLDSPKFSQDLPDVIDRAAAAGISKIICIGTAWRAARAPSSSATDFPPFTPRWGGIRLTRHSLRRTCVRACEIWRNTPKLSH